MRITGTFIDEITHDIPSQNWGPAEWAREFDLYAKIGIDTLVIIRAGYRNRCIYPSRVIPHLLPVYDDLGELLYSLADARGLSIFFGTYDSGVHWLRGDWRTECELNLSFLDEAYSRYGHHSSFAGWYLTHETSRNHLNIIDLFNTIGKHCKALRDVPVLISPYPEGAKQPGSQMLSLQQSMAEWEEIFSETQGAFDICAFQDGQVHYQELPAFSEAVRTLGNRYGVTLWANVESFDRDMPIKFPPADWRHLRFKLDVAQQTAEKIITFEFPHFMSPHSCYPAARGLFDRYCEHMGIISQG
jgi:hypothetical protein